ncbi:MAG: endonuclease MutS2 [Oscillospiraceae bacterium]|jgi:DNA mismatch repair protein MutS2|nr:endonuclease MutS2 [Oscillospiraceae bacterium]
MEDKALRVLEFYKIRTLLAEQCVSPLGRALAQALTPSSDYDEVISMQEITEEAVVVLTQLPHHPLIPFEDVSSYFKLASVGASLSPRALLDCAASMRAARAARSALVTERENTPRVSAMASRLATFRSIEEEIESAILGDDEIADRASTQLASIRRQIRQCHDRMRDKLNSIIHSSSMQKYLQDNIITQRNDRYVIPVKAEARSSVPGLIHDQSSTGATLFVEPMAVVEIGNDLKARLAEERREIERILAALSSLVADEAALLSANLKVLAELDLLFAKGKLSRMMRGAVPKLNKSGRIRIIRGRHPLLDAEKVVPIDLWLGDMFTTLVITGPNTGGKTVTLKTVGLFTLMAQAGLQPPADLGTELAVFNHVFADIGDEQSIEQSLSTFSSHMTNIVSILNKVDENSLALFDELGAGTDPTEGAALAQVILKGLLERKIRTMATTHYSELKAFALTVDGVENASAEFDVETLRPTFRLTIGVPGKSNAFEISRRLGLSDNWIDAAKTLLSTDQIRFEDVIANAEYHRKVAQRERQLAEEASRDMLKLRQEAEELRQRVAREKADASYEAKREARKILERARSEADTILSDLRKMKASVKSADSYTNADAERMSQRLRESIDAMGEGERSDEPIVKGESGEIKPGDTVHLINLNTQGKVIESPNSKGEARVMAGAMTLSVHVSKLRKISSQRNGEKNGEKKERTAGKAFSTVDVKTREVRRELDLRGMALDEALPEVDRFLDDAQISSLGEVSIIHGKGTGVLRSGVQQHLRKHPQVSEYRLGKYGEGEDGVTVVKVK